MLHPPVETVSRHRRWVAMSFDQAVRLHLGQARPLVAA